MEREEGLGEEPVERANFKEQLRTTPTLPSHKDPTIHLCAASQDTQARRQKESMQTLINYWGGNWEAAHSQLIKGTKNIYTKAAYGNQPKNPGEGDF